MSPPEARPLGSHVPSALHAARGAFNSAFSVGPGYEAQPLNADASYERVERYFLDLRGKTTSNRERVVTGRGEVLTPNATTLAQTAFGWWERHLDGDQDALRLFLTQVDLLLDGAERAGSQLLWRYDVDVPKYACRAPWYSSMAQGQAASVLTRAYLATGTDAYADAALGAVEVLREDNGSRRLVTASAEGPIFEECPSYPASHILNGWIFTLWALRDVYTALDVSEWRSPFERSCRALEHRLEDYDVGWWSRYSLFPRADGDIAKPGYHVVHADQMEVMYRLTGRPAFRDASLRWHGYDRPVHRARAVAVKARAVLGDRVRRSRRGGTSLSDNTIVRDLGH